MLRTNLLYRINLNNKDKKITFIFKNSVEPVLQPELSNEVVVTLAIAPLTPPPQQLMVPMGQG